MLFRSELYVQRLLGTDAVAASVDLLTSGDAVVATVTSKNAGTDGNNLRVVVTAGSVASTYTLTLYKESGVANDITDDILLERYENIVFNDPDSSDFAETVINLVSPNIEISDSASGVPVSTTYPLTGGDNGTDTLSTDYVEYKGGDDSVFEQFTPFDRPLVLFLPAVNALGSGVVDVFDAATSWAEEIGRAHV